MFTKKSTFLNDTIHALGGKPKKSKEVVSKDSDINNSIESIFIPTSPTVEQRISSRERPSKMTISIPSDLHRRFASRVAADGRTKSGTIQLLIKQYLSQTAVSSDA